MPFLRRPIEGKTFGHALWIDATYVRTREAVRAIVSTAMMIAVGVNTYGRREVPGVATGQPRKPRRSWKWLPARAEPTVACVGVKRVINPTTTRASACGELSITGDFHAIQLQCCRDPLYAQLRLVHSSSHASSIRNGDRHDQDHPSPSASAQDARAQWKSVATMRCVGIARNAASAANCMDPKRCSSDVLAYNRLSGSTALHGPLSTFDLAPMPARAAKSQLAMVLNARSKLVGLFPNCIADR